jgi:hypothetical protein
MPPLTIMGRFVSTVGLIVGLCLLALLLNATTQAMSFSEYEKKVYGNMKYQKHMQRRYGKAAQLISAAWIRYKAMNLQKGGCCCASTSYRQARAMDYFCTSLMDFRKLTVVEKRMVSGLLIDSIDSLDSIDSRCIR